MGTSKSTFALFFGNRALFPASLMAGAREELPRILGQLGHKCLMLDAAATNYGAVETTREGEIYARFLHENKGKFDGVILCLPNFGDENGALAALKDAGVPILIQAYPDELDKMDPDSRRDSFCGKLSIMDVFVQAGVPFTALTPHTAAPSSEAFKENVAYFDSVCRVVTGLKKLVVGAIGARTTPFKTVRIDEVALQRKGITVETFDLSGVISRVKALSADDAAVKEKAALFSKAASWPGVPETSFVNQTKLAVILDQMIEENNLGALAIRCWTELQTELGISPCLSMGLLNEQLIPAACEVDLGNAVTMAALAFASGRPPALLDWNNNYGDDPDKCILFHCGPVPPSLMNGLGEIQDHPILKRALGNVDAFGCNTGRIAPMPFTFGGLLTTEGKLKFYTGEAEFTSDPIHRSFFGCAGVAKIENLQRMLLNLGKEGHRHHVSLVPGNCAAPLAEALTNYMGCDVSWPQYGCGCKR